MNEKRKTSISWVEAERIYIRGYRIEDLIGRVSWGEAIFLVLAGRFPAEQEARMIEAIMVSVVDHGVRPPSTVAAVTVANTGAGLSSAVAAGILAINEYHGGAIESAMHAISRAVDLRQSESLTEDEAAEAIIRAYRKEGKRVSGFGHRFHSSDPRVTKLFEIAESLKIAGKYVSQARAIERVFVERFNKKLPMNADGAIAAILCELKFPPVAANGLFMASRIVGLIAHVIEEKERNLPMRTVNVEEYEYEGELDKKLDELVDLTNSGQILKTK